jgi:hypothetical protein
VGIEQRESFPHWRFAIALDEDLERLSRYIEFSEANLGCYSLELTRILMMASSEVDVIAKQLCEGIEPGCNARNIVDYRRIICSRHSRLTESKVHAFNESLELHPWIQWRREDSPLWWRSNNNVKHHRHTHYNEANLKNALNSVAALFILAIYFYEKPARDGLLAPSPRTLSIGAPIAVDRQFYNQTQLVYRIANDV